MRVQPASGQAIDLGDVETSPTIGMTDYSRRETDDFGVTTVVRRDFSRTLSVKLGLSFDAVDGVQRELADLRASVARWVADDRFEWLAVDGYYKDFSLDLAVPPLSYCTLTVEGIAETEAVADPGGDPSPDGQPSTLRMLHAVTVTDAMLVLSSVPEDDAPEWTAGTHYGNDARVISTGSHRVYESLIAGNVGHDPATNPDSWLDTGPTNRWSAFDQALGTAIAGAGPVTITLAPGAIDALALLDVTADSVRVQATIDGQPTPYDRTQTVGGGTILFVDLAGSTGQVTVTIAGAAVSVGTLILGSIVGLGITEASPTAGITDYSRKVADDFGAVSIVQRAWAKRMTAKALIRTDAIDIVANRIASVRAQPMLWLGQAGSDSLTVYGFFKDFSIEVDEGVSKLSLSIEGLSLAQKIAQPKPAVSYRGEWTAAIVYDQGDVVQYQGASYIAGNDVPAGTAPTNTLYWDVFAAAGAAGAIGPKGADGINPASVSVSSTAYTARYDAAGNLIPGQSITLRSVRQNVTATPVWSILNHVGAEIGARPSAEWASAYPAEYSSSGPDDLTVSSAFLGGVIGGNGGPEGRIAVGVRLDVGVSSYVSIQKVQDGAAGPAGVNGAPGSPGSNGQTSYVHFAWADSADGSVNFHTGAPAGSGFIGTYSDFSPAASASPGAYVWAPYAGPAVFGLEAHGSSFVRSDAVIKSGGAYGWDAGATSTEGWKGGAQCTFRGLNANGRFAGGLNSDPETDSGFGSIDYSWLVVNDGQGQYGARQAVPLIAGNPVESGRNSGWDETTTFQVMYDNRRVRWLKDGTEFASVAASPDQVLWFDSSVFDPGFGIQSITFSAVGSAGVDGSAGASGAPGANGRDGQVGATGASGAPGANGVSPALATITATSGTAHYSAANAYVGDAITFQGTLQNSGSAVAVFRLRRPDGSVVIQEDAVSFARDAYGGGVFTAPDANTLVLSAAGVARVIADFGGASGVFSIGVVANGYTGWADVSIQKIVDGAAGIAGAPGANGSSSYTHIAYANSADGSQDFVTGIANPGRVYIGIYVDATSAGSTDYRSYAWSRLTGQNGINGTNGTPGPVGANGQTSYVHFAYADSLDGRTNFTAGDPGSRTYIGVYSDYTVPDSNDPAAYSWSLIKGADGSPGAPGATGSAGATGATGAPGNNGLNGADGASVFTITDLQNCGIRTAKTITKAVGGDAWNGMCRTNESYPAATVSARLPVGAFVGLNEDSGAGPNYSYTNLNVGWHRSDDGHDYWIYWNGSQQVFNQIAGAQSGALYTVAWDGKTAIFIRNGQVFGTSPQSWVSMNAEFDIYHQGSTIYDIAFAPGGLAGNDGAIGAPGSPGAAGSPGPAGAPGSNGVSPSPAYPALAIPTNGTFTYGSPIPLNSGQTMTGTAYINASVGNASSNVTLQVQYSLDSGSSWSALATDAEAIDANTGVSLFAQGQYTNNSGSRVLVTLRAVLTRSGASPSFNGGALQPS